MIVAVTPLRRLARALERPLSSPTSAGLHALSARVFPSPRFESPTQSEAEFGARVIGIEGATLGGSWKTPTAIALVLALRSRGHRVGLLGHGYRGNATSARFVGDQSAAVVGDEARVGADVLGGDSVAIGERRVALALLRTRFDLVVADRGIGRKVVVVDGEEPFGSGRVVPFGDLRKPMVTLFRGAIAALAIVDAEHPLEVPKDVHVGVFDLTLPTLAAGARVGLVTAIARPHRLRRALARRGVAPVVHVELPDHGDPRALDRAARALDEARVDVVLTTRKCAATLPLSFGARAIDLAITLPDAFVRSVVSP